MAENDIIRPGIEKAKAIQRELDSLKAEVAKLKEDNRQATSVIQKLVADIREVSLSGEANMMHLRRVIEPYMEK